jgi:hypothetical protein
MSTFVAPRLHLLPGVQDAMSGFIRSTQHIVITDRGHREFGGETNGPHIEMIHCSNHFQQLHRRSISTCGA